MQREYILKLVADYTPNKQMAIALVDKLIEEGVVNEHYGNQEIGSVVETFKTSFGTSSVSRYDRFAAKRLVDKNGLEAVVGVISALSSLQDRQFVPVVNNVSQMERKWVSIVSFLKNQQTQEVKEL